MADKSMSAVAIPTASESAQTQVVSVNFQERVQLRQTADTPLHCAATLSSLDAPICTLICRFGERSTSLGNEISAILWTTWATSHNYSFALFPWRIFTMSNGLPRAPSPASLHRCHTFDAASRKGRRVFKHALYKHKPLEECST